MKVYGERRRNYGPQDEDVLGCLAGQAAILLANTQSLEGARRLSRQLTEALASRDTIVRATGLLIATGAAGEQEAVAPLAAAARPTGRPVPDGAQALVAAAGARNARG